MFIAPAPRLQRVDILAAVREFRPPFSGDTRLPNAFSLVFHEDGQQTLSPSPFSIINH